MTHNAATGEDLVGFTGCDNQGDTPISQQLTCGARALDYRPRLESDGTVSAHHCTFCPVNVLMSTSVQNIINWLAANPDELVILYVSHFEGSGTVQERKDASSAVLTSLGVDMIRENECASELAGLTIGDVKARAQLSSGGYLLAVFEVSYLMQIREVYKIILSIL